MSKMVMLSDTASAWDGMPHGAPVTVMVRFVPVARAVVLRESYCRQGVTPMKGRGLVASPMVVMPWPVPCGDQVAGADQLVSGGFSASAASARAADERKARTRREEILCVERRAIEFLLFETRCKDEDPSIGLIFTYLRPRRRPSSRHCHGFVSLLLSGVSHAPVLAFAGYCGALGRVGRSHGLVAFLPLLPDPRPADPLGRAHVHRPVHVVGAVGDQTTLRFFGQIGR